MRNLKKVLSLALALVMLLGMMMVGAGAATTTSADLSEANQEAIAVLKATKVMTNKRYGDPVTRAEAAKMALTIYNPDLAKGVKNTTDSAYFKDVKNHWAAGYIDLCFSTGIVSGKSSTVFDPNGNVTGYELAKMVMVAMGKTTKYTGSTWTSKVMKDVTELKLGANAKISNWSAPVTRLQAAQLTFNGMITNPEGAQVWVVDVDGTGATIQEFDDYELAKLVYAMNAASGATISSKPGTEGSLADVNFNLKRGTKEDGLGHSINIWKMGEKEVWAASTYTSTAAKTFAYQTITDADLKGVQYTDTVSKVVDGNLTNDANLDYSIKTTGDTAVKGLGKDNNIVELFAGADGKIDKIVVTNVYIGMVASVAEAKEDTKRTVTLSMNSTIDSTLGSAKTFENEDLQKDDVVLFTVGEKDSTAYVASCTVADSFVGQMTRYSAAKKTLTIGGVTYDLANDYADPSVAGLAVTVANLTDTSKVAAKTDYNFYTDAKGKIVAAKAVGEAPVELNYAVVDEIVYVEATSSGSGLSQTAGTDSLEARLVMTDGSTVIAKLSGIKVSCLAGKTFSTAATAGDNIEITSASDSNSGNFTAAGGAITGMTLNTKLNTNTNLIGKIVTYTYNEQSDTYAIEYTATASSTTVSYTNTATVTATAAATPTSVTVTVKGNPVYNAGSNKVADNNTVFLVKTTKDNKAVFTPYVGYKNVETITLTGQASDGGTNATAGVAYAEKDNVATLVYVDASVVPANTTITVGTPAAPVVDVVYILNMNFETDASGKDPVKVYDAIVDGAVGTVSVKSGSSGDTAIDAAGLYTVTKTDGVITSAADVTDGSPTGWKVTTVSHKAANGVLTTAAGSYGYDENTKVFMISNSDKVVEGATMDSIKEPVNRVASTTDGLAYNVSFTLVKDSSIIDTIYVKEVVTPK